MSELQQAVEILRANVSVLNEKIEKLEAREPRNERQAAKIKQAIAKTKSIIVGIEIGELPDKPFATQKCAESIIMHNEFVMQGRDSWSDSNVMAYASNLFEGRF
jgi:hypothetical protein